MFSLIRATIRCRPTRPLVRRLYTLSEDEIKEFIDDRQFEELTADTFKDLYSTDTSGKVRTIVVEALNEYEFLKYNSNGRVPSNLTIDDMRLIIEEGDTQLSRERLFTYYFKREMSRRSFERRRQREKEETKKKLQDKIETTTKHLGKHDRTGLLTEEGHIIYGLWHNSLFPRINDHSERVKFSANNLIRSALSGRKLIFDFGYDAYMRKPAMKGICEQVQSGYGLNRFTYDDPFDIWFCNFKKNSLSHQFMTKYFIQNLDSGSMITAKEGCFTEYFDKRQLVYLSPNAKKNVTEVHKSDDIYIIGAYNDKGTNMPLSLKKAEELGIRCQSLPLDKYLAWKSSSKNLCVNHVVGILLELIHNGNDWKAALDKHIPKRKLKTIEELELEEAYRAEKAKRKRRTQKVNIFDYV